MRVGESHSSDQRSEPSRHRQTGMIIAINVSTFVDLKSFYAEVQKLSKLIKTLGHTEVAALAR
jgi:hypothetical protein